jgi:N-succinyldiaminopimelate aminotransferase
MGERGVERMRGFGTTIFAEMTALAVRTGAVNLGQGFPDTDGPPEMLAAAVAAVQGGRNLYAPGPGIPELRLAIAAHQRDFYGLDFDPDTEVLVTAGATEAIAASLLALCEPGDEVLCVEPLYDSYAASITLAGAVARPIALHPPSFRLDVVELVDAVSPRTKVVLVNSPHNPTGAVFNHQELSAIARLCVANELIAITDEVYEHLVFEGEHIPLATLPGMRNRTVTISSAGKTFNCTGWKIGWVCAEPELIAAVTRVKQFLTFTSGAPLQPAVATALGLPRTYHEQHAAEMLAGRNLLCNGLAEAGFLVNKPAGTYFVTADITPFGEHDGVAFCRGLPDRCGVVAVPVAVFYYKPGSVPDGQSLVRFAFCKRRDVLEEAVRRLGRLRT